MSGLLHAFLYLQDKTDERPLRLLHACVVTVAALYSF
jgi:hypothetical protein